MRLIMMLVIPCKRHMQCIVCNQRLDVVFMYVVIIDGPVSLIVLNDTQKAPHPTCYHAEYRLSPHRCKYNSTDYAHLVFIVVNLALLNLKLKHLIINLYLRFV